MITDRGRVGGMQSITIISDDALFARMLQITLEGAGYGNVNICAEHLSWCDFAVIDLDFAPYAKYGEHSLTFSRSPYRFPDLVRPFLTERFLELFAERAALPAPSADSTKTWHQPSENDLSKIAIEALDKRRVSIGGKIISLSDKEYRLFSLLLSRRPEPVGKDEITETVFKGATGNSTEVCINSLRKKLCDNGIVGLIKTAHKRGYRLL